MGISTYNLADTATTIEELQQMLLDAGEDVAKIFGPALSTFAGPQANTKSSDEKYADMERLIMSGQK